MNNVINGIYRNPRKSAKARAAAGPKIRLAQRPRGLPKSLPPPPGPRRNPPTRPLPRKRRPRNNSRININNPTVTCARERVATITIDPSTTPGTLLYTLEANPTSAPRSGVVASQFDSWSGFCAMEVETTGNAFSKNYVILKHAPNGDPSRIPTTPNDLLNFSEAGNRRDDSVKLQLDSNRSAQVSAPWALSYNPKKPLLDTDPSERNNGVFILVANGTPGTETVTLTVRFVYRFFFYGPIAQKLVPDNSVQLLSTSTTAASPFLPANTTGSGPGLLSFTASTISFKPGRYLIVYNTRGTGLAGGPNPTTSTGTITVLQNSLSATSQTKTILLNSPSTAPTVSFSAEVLTTLTGTSLYAAPYTA